MIEIITLILLLCFAIIVNAQSISLVLNKWADKLEEWADKVDSSTECMKARVEELRQQQQNSRK